MDIIKKPSDFKKIYAGKKFYTNIFSVHFIKGKDSSSLPFFGFTISKKTVSKKAVIRNLVRRRLKEAIRQYFKQQDFLGYHIVITAIKTTKDAPWNDYINCVNYCQLRIKKMDSLNADNKTST